MLPAPLTNLLRRVLMGAMLLFTTIFLLMWPARHVLVPLWPSHVAESVYQTSSATTQHVFHPAGHEPEMDGQLIARDRPLSVYVIETDGREQRFVAYLVGMRSEPDALIAGQLPRWLDANRVKLPAQATGVLVFEGADAKRIEVPLADVQRLYRPNRLKLDERAIVAWQNFDRQWSVAIESLKVFEKRPWSR